MPWKGSRRARNTPLLRADHPIAIPLSAPTPSFGQTLLRLGQHPPHGVGHPKNGWVIKEIEQEGLDKNMSIEQQANEVLKVKKVVVF